VSIDPISLFIGVFIGIVLGGVAMAVMLEGLAGR
jgi:hypothetical protein